MLAVVGAEQTSNLLSPGEGRVADQRVKAASIRGREHFGELYQPMEWSARRAAAIGRTQQPLGGLAHRQQRRVAMAVGGRAFLMLRHQRRTSLQQQFLKSRIEQAGATFSVRASSG